MSLAVKREPEASVSSPDRAKPLAPRAAKPGQGGEQPGGRVARAVAESVAALAAGVCSAEYVIDTLLVQFERHLDARIVRLYGLGEGGSLRLLVQRGIASAAIAGASEVEPARGATLVTEAVAVRSPLRVEATMPEASAFADTRAIFSCCEVNLVIAAPLLAAGQILGAVTCGIGHGISDRDEPQAVAAALASVFAWALDGARQQERLLKHIDELGRAQEVLRNVEERLNRTIDDAPIGMAVVGLDGRFVRVNRVLCDIVGYGREELERMRFQDITHPEDLEIDLEQAARLIRGEIERYQLAKRYLRKTGEVVDVMLSASMVRDARGMPLHYISQIEDITEKRRIEDRLRQSERKYHAIFHSAREAIVLLDEQMRFVDANPAACALFHETREALVGRRLTSLVTPTTAALLEAPWQRLSVQGELDLEVTLHLHDGSAIPVELGARAHFVPGFHLMTLRDVSRRKRTEAALRLSEARFRFLAENASDVVYQVAFKPHRRFEYVSPSVLALTGYPVEQWYADPELAAKIAHEDDRQTYARFRGDPNAESLLLRFYRKNGELAWVEIKGTTIRDELGVPIGLIAVARDITERKRAEQEREQLVEQIEADRSRLRSVIEHTPVGIVLALGARGERTLANRRAAEILGRPPRPDEVSFSYLAPLCDPSGKTLPPEEHAMARALRGEETRSRELVVCRPDDPGLPVLESASPVRDAHGHVLGAIATYEDITRLKRLEQLRDEWSSIVAHELRQPLTAIASHAALLARTDEPTQKRRAENISQSAARLNRLIGDLLDTTRIDAKQLELALEPTDLASLVRGAVERASLGGWGEIDVVGDVPPVLVDPTRIEQVLGNLLSNAVKYGAPETPIRVEIEGAEEGARVSVHNQGARIPAEDIPRLFQRFRRLHKGPVLGVGLGLYVCRGIIEAHRGRIWVESDDEGTTFRFTLPRAESGAARR
ncbi:PAS domain S-box protein [Polyangium sp. 6x1]|uniref:PAS domain-containing sensor histidine kinase n=1 Tax=Polyangium sp. 6x1 TaxID=3042689 RepID=UPI0024828770|nr:PAS domain S-box protein [Polyangium sp. 6x1]MDI1449051.1 PAS domain S-box protein [Polyangium sp. 6x1]